MKVYGIDLAGALLQCVVCVLRSRRGQLHGCVCAYSCCACCFAVPQCLRIGSRALTNAGQRAAALQTLSHNLSHLEDPARLEAP